MDGKLIMAMGRALALAKQAWGNTHPNPMVGAVIVENDQMVAEGWHHAAGQDHAEVNALKALGRPPRPDATLFVTLEPCSTVGRTGACTQAIIESGIRRVVIGTTDPNPAHAGRGIDILRQAGVEVIEGVLEIECRDLNLLFNHWITQNRPLIAAKIATTLDGKVATRTGSSQWITGPDARQDAHLWRRLFPGIACGSGTLATDNPSLTSRRPDTADSCGRRFVFDRTLSSLGDLDAKVFTDSFRDRTTVVAWEDAAPDRIAKLKRQDIGVWQLPAKSDKAFFDAFSQQCADEGITGVLVEGGPRLLSALLDADSLDYLFAYRAPKLIADDEAPTCMSGQNLSDISQAFTLTQVQHASLGDDQLMRGFLVKP